MSHWSSGAFVAVLAGSAVACASGDPTESDAAFMDGRETIEVFRLEPPEGFDAEVRVREWAELFDIEDRFVGPNPDLSVGLTDGDISTGQRAVGINLQTGDFGFRSEAGGRNNTCGQCTDATIDLDDATARAKESFASMGFDVDEFEWSAERLEAARGENYATVWVDGQRMQNGLPFGSPFRARFVTGDALLTLTGSVNVPVSRGEVGMLTPAEALAQESASLAADVPVESVERAELAWDVSIDRSTLVSTMVPVYRFPLTSEFGLATTVLAIRSSDVPSE